MDAGLGVELRPTPLTSSSEGRIARQGLTGLGAIAIKARITNIIAAGVLPACPDRIRPPYKQPSCAIMGRQVEVTAPL